MTGLSGELNPNWKGGRTITEHGYVLIRVGVDHHLADVRGYAYEHRVIAEKILGRQLVGNEMVHHKDGDKRNNSPANLTIVNGNAGHLVHHRKRTDTQLPGEANRIINCGCGCGKAFPRYDNSGRPRAFVSGHNMRMEGKGRGHNEDRMV